VLAAAPARDERVDGRKPAGFGDGPLVLAAEPVLPLSASL